MYAENRIKNTPKQPRMQSAKRFGMCWKKPLLQVSVVCARYYVLSHPFTRFSLRLRAQNARKSRAPPEAARERRQHSYSALPGLLFQAFGGRARKRDSEFFGLFKRITFFNFLYSLDLKATQDSNFMWGIQSKGVFFSEQCDSFFKYLNLQKMYSKSLF